MKKIALLGLLALVAMGAWSFNAIGITSLERDASFGIFNNQIDDAVRVGPGFLELDQLYLFGGLANLDQVTNTGTASSPIHLGVFYPGDTPWSFFTRIQKIDPTGLQANTNRDFYNYATEINDEVYEWIERNEETKYAGRLANSINNRLLFNTLYDGMVVGGALWFQTSNTSNLANNFKRTTTFYYDSSATPGTTEPIQSLDYTIEEERTDLNKSFIPSLYAAAFMPGQNVDMTIAVGVGMERYNWSESHSRIYSSTADTNHTQTDIIRDDMINKLSRTFLYGFYMQDMASPLAMFDSGEKDFFFNGSVTLDFYNRKYETYDESQIYDYTAGADPVKSTYNNDTLTMRYGSTMNVSASVNTGQEFGFDLGNGVFLGMIPAGGISFSSEAPWGMVRLKGFEDVDTADNNDDGTIDVTVTTTGDAKHMMASGGLGTIDNSTRTTRITLSLDPACALRYQREGWKLGFTLGAEGTLSVSRIMEKSKQGTAVLTEVEVDGATTTTEVTKTNTNSPATSNSYFNWTAQIAHRFGLNYDISDNVRFLIDLSSAGNQGLLNFENLTVQALIALP